MGALMPFAAERQIEVSLAAASAIDYVEVLYNNRVIRRESVYAGDADFSAPVKVRLELGWGELEALTDWDVDLRVEAGELLGIEPHLRGHDIGIPVIDDRTPCVLSQLNYAGGNRLQLRTQTPRNASVTSSSTQAITLQIAGDADSLIRGRVNGVDLRLSLAELAQGARSFYSGGFVSPSFVFHRALPQAEYRQAFALNHESAGAARDWYYARVRLRNGQWAWSSPIWVAGRV